MGRNNRIKMILFEIISSFLIIVISLRSYIFGNGFFDYADQYWIPNITYPHLVSLSPVFNGGIVEVLGYTRTIVTAPGVLLEYISSSPVIQEKIFIVYTFLLFLGFSYVFAELLYRLADRYLDLDFGLLGREFSKLFVVLAIYTNIAIMNLNVDGGTWADGLIMIFIAISVSFSVYSRNVWKVIGVSSALLSVSILLDPDYYLVFLLVVFFSNIINLGHPIIERFKISIFSILLSIPVVLYIIYAMILTASGIPSNPLAGRLATDAAAHYGGIMNPVTSVLLVAHYWSTYSISPPTILFLVDKNVPIPFFGNIVLLPASWITAMWIIFLALYPVIAISSLYFRETRLMSLPFAITWVVSFLLTIWWRVPFLNSSLYWISHVEMIGPAIGTSLAEPGHYMNVEAMSEIALISITMYNVWNRRQNIYGGTGRVWILLLSGLAVLLVTSSFFTLYGIRSISIPENYLLLAISLVFISLYISQNKRITKILNRIKNSRPMRGKFRIVITIIIVFIMIFVGWQAFDGSFYPERAWTGNSAGILSNPGPFDPVYIPNYVIDTYSALSSNLSYNTVFYAPTLPNNPDGGYQFAGLSYLIGQNYSSAIKGFLDVENIKYIITYKDPSFILYALNSSGLKRIYLGPYSYLYINNETEGQIYGANMLLNYSSNDQNFYLLYSIFRSLGYTPVISNTGENTVGFNTLSDRINILSPAFLSSEFPIMNWINTSSQLSHNETIATLSAEAPGLVGNFRVFDNSTATTIMLENGTFVWNVQKDKTISISYANYSWGFGFYGIPVPDFMNLSVVAKITFLYRESENFSGNLSGSFGYIYKPTESSGFQYEATPPHYFESSTSWTQGSYSFMMPRYTALFIPSINMNGSSGSIMLKDINITYGMYENQNDSSIYTNELPVGNSTINFDRNGQLWLELKGNGTVNGFNFSSERGEWLSLNVGEIKFRGNLSLITAIFINSSSLNYLQGNYTVYNEPYNIEYRYVQDGRYYHPFYTLTGQMFFHVKMTSQGKIYIINIYNLFYAYIAIVLYIAILLILPSLIFKKGKKRGK